MKKNFTFILPDEPYKNTTALNQVVNSVYDGPRYLVARVDDITNIVINTAYGTENLDDIDLSKYFEEDHSFIIIDASINAFEAAYLTGLYTHDLIQDPTFDLLNNLGSWTYHYDDYKGGMNQCFFQHQLGYDKATSSFIAPSYRTHALSAESVFDGAKRQSEEITAALAINDYSTEDRAKLTAHATWLKNLAKTYKGIDHWKIPFPTDIPPI